MVDEIDFFAQIQNTTLLDGVCNPVLNLLLLDVNV